MSSGWIVMVATSRGLWISIFKYRFRDTVAADEVIRLVVKKKVGGAAGVEPAGHGWSVTWALRASLYEVGVGAENGSVLPDELLCSLLRFLAHTLRCTLL